MNEYTFFQAAEKAKVGETLRSVSNYCPEIIKEARAFRWKDDFTVVRMGGVVLGGKWIIVEEDARIQMEKKMKNFLADLSEEELSKLHVLLIEQEVSAEKK